MASNEIKVTASTVAADHFSKDDVVRVASGAKWLSGSSVPSWVLNLDWIVKEVSTTDGRVVIDKSTDGKNSVNSPIHYSYLTIVKATTGGATNNGGYVGMKYSDANPPLVCMQTQSSCYKGTNKNMTIRGVLWHSTGANNKTLKRYVQPSDNDPNKAKLLKLLGKNTSGTDWNHTAVSAGLNCWIGTLADGTVTTVQTMPWNYKPWGCGSGSKGSCNNGWIQFEICEDGLKDKAYFDAVYKEACEITAYLCRKFNLDPHGTVTYNRVKVPVILCHADSYDLKLGSNHADVEHWFPKYGKSMKTVRNDVAKLLAGAETTTPPIQEEGMYTKGTPTRLSTNFKSTEFDCNGEGCCTTTEIYSKLVDYLQDIRTHFGKPLNIRKAYCCEAHNKSICGESDSYHLYGQAADFVVTDATPLEIARYAESIGVRGIGLYETDADGHYVHIDTREVKSFWYGKSKQPRVTFQKIDTSKINTAKADPEYIWNFLKGKGFNDFAIAGILGNLEAESNLLPINIQDTFGKKFGLTDAEYTAAVDSGLHTNFIKDGAGYGLVQWTYHTRKEKLLKWAQARGKSVGDLDVQLEVMWQELSTNKTLMKTLEVAPSVRAASDTILHDYEAPADQSEAVEIKRAEYSQKYYDKYAACTHPESKVVNKKAATCVADGYTGDKVCTRCGAQTWRGLPINKLGHDYILTGNVEATIDQDGYTGDQICSRCGHTIKGETIPKLSPIVVTPEEDDVTITIKKSWIQKVIEWLTNLIS